MLVCVVIAVAVHLIDIYTGQRAATTVYDDSKPDSAEQHQVPDVSDPRPLPCKTLLMPDTEIDPMNGRAYPAVVTADYPSVITEADFAPGIPNLPRTPLCFCPEFDP